MYRKSVKKISPGRKKKKKVQFVGLFHPSEGLLLVPFPEYLHSWFSTFSIFSCLWLLFTGWPHPRWSLFCGVVYIIYLILPFVGRRSPKRLNVYPALQIFTLTTWVWIYIYICCWQISEHTLVKLIVSGSYMSLRPGKKKIAIPCIPKSW